VRLDESYAGGLGSSLFDFTDTTPAGGVMNRQVIVGPSIGSTPACFAEYVSMPGFPVITESFLRDAGAVFGGVVDEPLVGRAQTVSLSAFRD
jgi:hypothetical protein